MKGGNILTWIIMAIVVFFIIAYFNPNVPQQITKGIAKKTQNVLNKVSVGDSLTTSDKFIKTELTCIYISNNALFSGGDVETIAKNYCFAICGNVGMKYSDYGCSEDGGFLTCECR